MTNTPHRGNVWCMKQYPSIPQCTGQKFFELRDAHVFNKLDGSSMRSEWTRKSGWCKHGRRHGLLDDSNPALLRVPALFDALLREPLTRLAVDNRWQNLVAFYEFWGPKSLAGVHAAEDDFRLTLFDVAVDKRGLLGPKSFIDLFYDVPVVDVPNYLGRWHWTRGFVQDVYAGLMNGVTSEGVVGKAGEGHRLTMAKAKTREWVEKVRRAHGSRADAILNS